MSINVATESATASEAMHPQQVELTILMPCLNEAETLAVVIMKAIGFLEQHKISGEVMIADNGSSDGSQDIARKLGARVVHVNARGYGAALLGGIKAARGRYIIMGDSDDSYDFTSLMPFVEKLRAGDELVMGNRFKGGIAPGAMPPLHRYLGNPVLSLIGRVLFKIPVGDFHCGLRAFNTASIRKLNLRTTGMEFASEMVVRASLAQIKMSEVPATLKPDGRNRPPHLKSWRDGWRHLKFLLMYSPKWLFFIPGGLLTLIGMVLSVLLWFGASALPGGGPVLDINTFTAACFMVIAGVQIVSFGVLSRTYALSSGMLPPGTRSNWLRRMSTTDNIARLAVLVLAAGLAIFGSAVWMWLSVGLGDLDRVQTPRIVITGLSLGVIGVQLGFLAFMQGILDIPFIRTEIATRED